VIGTPRATSSSGSGDRVESGVYVDLTELDRALADVEVRGKRMGPAFRALRRPLRQDQRSHARSEEGPDGAWPTRSPLTEARRVARNRRVRITKAMRTIAPRRFAPRSTPKQLLGRLPAAMVVVVGELFVRATSRVPWAGIHQEGGSAGHGRRVRIPKRLFLWLSDKFLEETRAVLAAHIVKGWKR